MAFFSLIFSRQAIIGLIVGLIIGTMYSILETRQFHYMVQTEGNIRFSGHYLSLKECEKDAASFQANAYEHKQYDLGVLCL